MGKSIESRSNGSQGIDVNGHGVIEHRLFSFISINWRGRPLRTYETVVGLIANTTKRISLDVRARIDKRRRSTDKKIPKKSSRRSTSSPTAGVATGATQSVRARNLDRPTFPFESHYV